MKDLKVFSSNKKQLIQLTIVIKQNTYICAKDGVKKL